MPNNTAVIQIGNTTIKPVNQVKYLGVLFDHRLYFAQHTLRGLKYVENV